MRDDADFAAYVAARWALLLRSLVLIGCPRATAEDLAVDALARCYGSWNRIRDVDDPDAYVFGGALDAWHRTLRGRGEERDEDREVVVLRTVGGLDEFQVADVLDVSYAVAARRTSTDLRATAEPVEIGPVPYDRVLARYDELRRRRRRTSAKVVVVGALVLGALVAISSWTGSASDGGERTVIEGDNPIAQPWYGRGRLQLRHVAVELADVGGLVEVADGAVYVDGAGELAFVDPVGRVTDLGTTPPGSPVVASDDRSWVAWLAAGDEPELVLHDVVRGEEVARVEAPADTVLVALDQNTVFFRSDGQTRIWEPLTSRVQDLGDRTLLDSESAVRVYGDGTTIEIVTPLFSASNIHPGVTAELSPGGAFALVRSDVTTGSFLPAIYSARSGEVMPTGLAPGELVIDAAFGPDGTINYLVVTDDDPDVAVLRSCHLGTTECVSVVPLSRDEVEPRLAH